MVDDQHFAQLKDIVKLYLPEDVSVGAIVEDSNFVKELNINSANLVDIVLDVEDAFGIRLENEDMDKMQTVRDALNIIAQKLQDKN
ncbi:MULTISPECIES: phosphopantetheine-binding protein [Arenibacter]|uniref:phosphopantetheine-binding protein n=1 Tax=Arenibacter TaxID=178469 RepID=UPI001C0684FE|nr:MULTISPECIES: phosphopantetheine-binding protein [Arenibacter]MBU2905462.1 acyl carrier protein [Arenibacter algicola]MCK0135195.1 phosphopantetheine-binding protein [Arenibacter sp. S6351L]